ncbi:MAG: DUF2299 family protein [Haloarculaceae archaeon]
MADDIDSERVRNWLDEELITGVEHVPDEEAAFNLAVEMSNLVVHVVRRSPEGPLVVGQQIEYGPDIRDRIAGMEPADRNELVARLRETLTAASVVYGFHDERGANVQFGDVHRVLLERRVYPGSITRQSVMDAVVDVWKLLRYLDDIPALLDAVES